VVKKSIRKSIIVCQGQTAKSILMAHDGTILSDVIKNSLARRKELIV